MNTTLLQLQIAIYITHINLFEDYDVDENEDDNGDEDKDED